MKTEAGFEVTVLPGGQRFHAAASQTLLQAALAAGVDLPRGCRNGTCRACFAQLVEGTIVHCIEWPGLSAEEKAQGCVLPCVAVATSAIVMRLPQR